jgi:hypothetical protein
VSTRALAVVTVDVFIESSECSTERSQRDVRALRLCDPPRAESRGDAGADCSTSAECRVRLVDDDDNHDKDAASTDGDGERPNSDESCRLLATLPASAARALTNTAANDAFAGGRSSLPVASPGVPCSLSSLSSSSARRGCPLLLGELTSGHDARRSRLRGAELLCTDGRLLTDYTRTHS